MKSTVMIGGERMDVSVKAYDLIRKLKSLERSNREHAKTTEKFSQDSARCTAVAEAFSTSILLFAEAYARPR